MNKNLKFGIALASLSLALAACTKPTPKPEPDPDPAGSWSVAAKAKMNEVLGHELPYYDIGEYSFDYDEKYEVWEIYNTTSTSRVADAKAYSALLANMQGYEVYDVDEEDEDEGVFYSYYKVIEEDEETVTLNYVDVQTWKDYDDDDNFLGTYTLWIDFERYTQEKEPGGEEDEGITAWTSDQEAAMEGLLGFVLPLPEAGLPAGSTIEIEDDVTLYVPFEVFDDAVALFNFYETYLLSEEAGFEGGHTIDEDYGDYYGSYSRVDGVMKVLEEDFDYGIGVQAAAFDYTGYEDYGTTNYKLQLGETVFSKESDGYPSDAVAKALGEGIISPLVAFDGGSSYDYQYLLSEDEEGGLVVTGIKISVSASDEAFEAYLNALFSKAYLVDDYSDFSIAFFGYGLYVGSSWYEDIKLDIADYLNGGYELILAPSGEVATPLESFPSGEVATALGVDEKTIIADYSALVDKSYGYKLEVNEDSKAVRVMFVDNGEGEDTYLEEFVALLASYEIEVLPATYEDEGEEIQYGYYAVIDAGEDVGSVVLTMEQVGNVVIYTYELKAPVGNAISFQDESQVVSATDELATWKFKHGTMSVAKGTSATNVGNGSFLSNPLRLYNGQVVTFNFDEGYVPDQIVIECNTTASKSKLVNLTENSTIVGATVESVDGNTVTLKVAEDATEVSITIGGGQIHFDSVSFVYVAL